MDDVFMNTTWSDMADAVDGQVPYASNDGLATDHAYVNLVSAGSLVPEEVFAAFQGENPIGVWLLTISDDASGDAAPNGCCGGIAPAVRPLMLGGWSGMRRRARRHSRRVQQTNVAGPRRGGTARRVARSCGAQRSKAVDPRVIPRPGCARPAARRLLT